MTEKEKLGKHLLNLRKKISSKDYKYFPISQQELADNNSDLTKFFIGSIERGEANPTLDKLVSLAKALNEKTLKIFNVEIDVNKYLREKNSKRK